MTTDTTTTMPMPPPRSLDGALAAARPFLRGEEGEVDPALPELAAVLRAAGAGECWHKHGTFLAHLLDVYRILRLWRAPDAVARCGLYHSAYSNSYVNLAIFQPDTGRAHVAGVVGAPAERLVHLFCVVPRQQLIHDDLLFHYTDQELVDDLARSEASLQEAAGRGVLPLDDDEPWRRKIQRLLPHAGITVKHIRTGEDVALSRRIAAAFLLMTMADFSDQLFDWQDRLFDNTNGRLEFRGNTWTSLWPGTGKPGLWVASISRMAALYTLIARDEELYCIARRGDGGDDVSADRDEDIDLVIPPVFSGCTRVLDADDQKVARDLYWEAVCSGDDEEAAPSDHWLKVEQLLQQSIAKNPFVGEPHLVLAQVYLNMERYGEARVQAEEGLKLLLEWGSSWDKRMPWEGWVSWGRAMLTKAREEDWPHTSFGVLSLGLVK
ncbi:hypothetical protein BS78_04G327900 [Paspalum vaginatum]|nr:hypothetical protein BS78_04G327900 [Paspalum vaginatum]